MTDVLVVGGGPAGSAAAIELRRQGRDVIVIDKATFPRDKCCGDGLTTEALRILEGLGLQPGAVDNWNAVTDVVIRDPAGRQMQWNLPDDGQFAAIVPRMDLDHRLLQLAAAAGAEIREGVGFADLEQLTDRVVVTTSDHQEIHARYVVAADGMWSGVRRAAGLDVAGYRGDWHAFRQYFSNVGPQAQHLVVWFEPDLLPGYAWSFPLPGQRANVGFGILRDGKHKVGDMGRLWTDLLQRPHVQELLGPDAVPEDRHRAWPIPARLGALATHDRRVLLTGDAIGATDPMTGEGIAQALQTGQIAAAAIAAGGPHRPDVAGRTHADGVERHLGRDHRFARRLNTLLTKSSTTRLALRAADLTPWTRRNFARWMFEDYPRALLFTPRRWHRGAFAGPGAYRDQDLPEPTTPAGDDLTQRASG